MKRIIGGIRTPGYIKRSAGLIEIKDFALFSDEMIYVLFIFFLF